MARQKRGATFFWRCVWIWHSISFDNLSDKNCCFYAICFIILHYFTLDWKWRFYRVSDTTRNAFSTDSFKEAKSTKKCKFRPWLTCILFFRFFERYDVIDTHYSTILKCFAIVCTHTSVIAIQFVACCCSAAEQSNAVFIKNGDGAQDARGIA